MSVYQEAYHLPEFTYDYEKLKIEQRGSVYICSFNDADNLNAMSYAQMAEFNDFLIKVRMDKDCRVIVLTGEGRSFCAGFNLNDLALDPPEDMGRIQRDFYIMQRMCSDQIINMRRCEQPIIGALKGFAVGGACVSEKHAGFIVNKGGATCADVEALIRAIQDTVFQATGVELEPEIRRISLSE